jgi:hypothetical protein
MPSVRNFAGDVWEIPDSVRNMVDLFEFCKTVVPLPTGRMDDFLPKLFNNQDGEIVDEIDEIGEDDILTFFWADNPDRPRPAARLAAHGAPRHPPIFIQLMVPRRQRESQESKLTYYRYNKN